jgi:hypothetical protein
MAIKLRIAGIGYDGAPAGTGGEEFEAQDTGDERDKVYYKVSKGGGIVGAIKELVAEDVRSAYLDQAGRSSLESACVIYKTRNEVLAAGMSNYVLWLTK